MSSLIGFLLGHIIHPVEIGGDEHVGRRAALDLASPAPNLRRSSTATLMPVALV